MKKFFKSSKDDKAKELSTSFIEETKNLAEVYRKNNNWKAFKYYSYVSFITLFLYPLTKIF